MSKNYAVRLRCPYGDNESWIILENRDETLEQILRTSWDFECEAHGVQREFPMEASAKDTELASKPQAAKPAAPGAEESYFRSSERRPLHVPVLVYGWSDPQGAFHEEASTMVVNSSGALVTLAAKVKAGDLAFLVNRISSEEQEVRVAYVEQEFEDKRCVGLAFKNPCPYFWRRTRQKPRIPEEIRVIVRGTDTNGNAFVHSAYTVDISKSGARLDGVGYLAKPGATIEVKRRWRGKASYRVMWVGQVGTDQVNQVGLFCLDTEKNIWGVRLPESEAEASAKPSSPSKKRRSS